MFLILICLLASLTDCQETAQQKCDNMLTSFKYLCPGHIDEITPEVANLKAGLRAVVEVNRKLINELAETKKQIEELKQNCSNCETGQKRKVCEQYGVIYGGKCYFLVDLKSTYHMTHEEAIAQCALNDSLLAEIHDSFLQTTVMDFIHAKIPSGISLVEVWVGMEYDSTAKTLKYRSGKETPKDQFQWYSDFYPFGSNTFLALDVRSDQGGNEGLWNAAKTTPLHGVMCETDI